MTALAFAGLLLMIAAAIFLWVIWDEIQSFAVLNQLEILSKNVKELQCQINKPHK